MSAVKSIQAVDNRLTEIESEMAAEFVRLNPSHPLAVESTVLTDAKRRLSAINGAAAPQRIGGSLERKIPKRKGKQPKGRVAQHEAAEAAVRAAGHPLTTVELVQALPSFGATPSAMNAEVNLTSIISKRGNLRSIRWRDKRAWWLRDQEVPE